MVKDTHAALRGIDEIAGCRSTREIKLIALLFMLIDHGGKMLFHNMTELRLLGRIAFPLYAWCIVVGACATKSFPKYIGRILAVGIVSQPLYMIALGHRWGELARFPFVQPNIFFTLALAVAMLWAVRARWYGSHVWGPAIALALAVLCMVDYNVNGILIVLLLYAVRGSKAGIAAVMTAFCLYWGSSSGTIVSLFGMDMRTLTGLPVLGKLLTPWLRLQAMAILSLPLMLINLKSSQGKMPLWLSYALYPLHLLLLIGLEYLFPHGIV